MCCPFPTFLDLPNCACHHTLNWVTYFRYLLDPYRHFWVYNPRLRPSCLLTVRSNLNLLPFCLGSMMYIASRSFPVLGEVIAGGGSLPIPCREYPTVPISGTKKAVTARPHSWNQAISAVSFFVFLGRIQGDDRRCRFSEGDLWNLTSGIVAIHSGFKPLTPLRFWSMDESHPVRSLELEDNPVSVTSSRTSLLEVVCLGPIFWHDQSQSERTSSCHLTAARFKGYFRPSPRVICLYFA